MNKLNKKQIPWKKSILTTAINALAGVTGVTAREIGPEIREVDKQTEARILLGLRSGQQWFNVEVKGELRQAALSDILSQFGKEKDTWLLVSTYIPGTLKEELRNNGINYLEATGNCYINTGNIYLYVNDREVKQVRKTPEGKLWKASGLKLLFVLIQDPALVTATYRQLSELAGIALGSITPLLDELRNEGYIQKDHTNGEEMLIDRDRLMTRWAGLYPVVLRPRLSMGTFRFLSDQQAGKWRDLHAEGIYWGGEPAGNLYTHHLLPEVFTLYTYREANELVKLLKIVPDENGRVLVFQKFWQNWPGSASVQAAVPPLLAYADLINEADSRAWETAEKIKTKYFNGKPIS
jgi:hypothetical protein